MKQKQYLEMIEIKKEIKNYTDICKCKSNKFEDYTEWKRYIKAKLMYLNNTELENYKQIIIYQNKLNLDFSNVFLTLMTIVITLITASITQEINNSLTIGAIILPIEFTVLIMQINHSKNKAFYETMIQIIEEMQIPK